MLTFEQARDILSDLADSIPEVICRELNGGIILQPDEKISSHSLGDDLYTMGEYNYDPRGLGRYITIYYGSLIRVYGTATEKKQAEVLRQVLHHELIHHIESLAGDRTLERQDDEDLMRYRQSHEE